MKTCSKCFEEKPLDRFGRASWIKSGYLAHCKDCDNKRKRESETKLKTADPEGWAERQREYQARYREKHPERVKEQDRRQSLKYKFGMTVEDYDRMLASQGGVCAVCDDPPTEKRLAVDHDRSCCPGNVSCGECVRKLLCGKCNTALGLLRDNLEYIERIKEYVKGYK